MVAARTGRSVTLDGSDVAVHSGRPSSATVGQPSATVGQPSATVGQPSATVGQPSATVGRPSSATVGQPSATVGHPSATVGQPSATVGQPSAVPVAGSNVRRQFLWLATAIVTGWMAAMIVVVASVLAGIMPTANAQVVVTVATAASSIAIYARFRRLGRIDEVVVLAIMVSWAATLGLLSL